jgi:tetratricopeptide (TPR) repeat protein
MKGILATAIFLVIQMNSQTCFSATNPAKSSAAKTAAAPADVAAPDTAVPVESATSPADVAAPAIEAPVPAATAEPTAADFMKKGDLLAKKGQTEKAMDAYKQCLEKAADDPSFARVVLIVGKYYYGKKMYAEALPLLMKVTGKDIDALPFKIMLASTHVAVGTPDSAIALLEPIASNQKVALTSRKDMFRIIGDAYLKLKQDDKAVAWYNKHIATGGAKTADMAYLVTFEQEKTAPAKAKIAYELNVKSFPNDYRNFVRLGKLNANARATLPTALTQFKKASSLVGDTIASIWLEIGKVNASLGKKNDEMEAYRTSLRINENNLDALIRLGSALLDNGLNDEAVTNLEKAHKLAPDSIGPMVVLSSAYIKSNNPKKAIELLQKLKTAQPANIEVRKQLVDALIATGQDKKAVEEVNAALEVERDPSLLLSGGKLFAKLKQYDDAIVLLEELRGLVPDDVDMLMLIARVKRDQGKGEEAVEIYKEINTYDTKYAPSLYERAEIHFDENKVKWAEMFYQRALTADPNYALAEVGLGKIQLLFKNNAAAEDHFTKAFAMAPSDPAVRKAIDAARNPKKAVTAAPAAAPSGGEDQHLQQDQKKDKKRRK